MINEKPDQNRLWSMLILILAGEAVFFLPFVIARVFRPTLLEVFQLTNFELGIVFSVYGTVAMIAYFFGGLIADRFHAKKLMSVALAATAMAGLVMYAIPSFSIMKWLYGFWGLTTILLFWAALIRATREWGGEKIQGRAFGFLDGGRGLTAALMGSVAVLLFSEILPTDVSTSTLAQKTFALKGVIGFVSFLTFFVSLLVWFVLPNANHQKTERSTGHMLEGLKKVLHMPAVWLQAVIIICAYVGYKITDDFSLFAKEVLEFDDVQSAGIGTMALWIRPVVALAAGFVADKIGAASKIIAIGFVLTLLGSIGMSCHTSQYGVYWFFSAIVTTSIGVFACRSLYFATMEEGKVPLLYTGTAVGIVSVVGYTPDIFMGPLMGYLLDSAPGALGHRHLFFTLSGFSMVGLIASLLLLKFKN